MTSTMRPASGQAAPDNVPADPADPRPASQAPAALPPDAPGRGPAGRPPRFRLSMRAVQIIQIMTQLLFLALFIALLIRGQIQVWMGLFLFGIIGSIFFGRFYCGWICSINTVLGGISWIRQKMRLKSLAIPSVLRKAWVRYLALGLFLAAFIFSMVSGRRLPVLPVLFGLGISLTLLFPESFWHRYLCPFGTLLHLAAGKTGHGLQITPDRCNNCGACRRVCPAEAVSQATSQHTIRQSDCLVCLKCGRKCKQQAIHYH